LPKQWNPCQQIEYRQTLEHKGDIVRQNPVKSQYGT
jgi:hypothetical protein